MCTWRSDTGTVLKDPPQVILNVSDDFLPLWISDFVIDQSGLTSKTILIIRQQFRFSRRIFNTKILQSNLSAKVWQLLGTLLVCLIHLLSLNPNLLITTDVDRMGFAILHCERELDRRQGYVCSVRLKQNKHQGVERESFLRNNDVWYFNFEAKCYFCW